MSAAVRVVDDPAGEVAELLVARARKGSHIALTGGSTPRAAYERAAALDPGAFAGAALWFGDERCVEPTDERSNFGMAKAALLDRLDPPAKVVHRIQGELGAETAAAQYEMALRTVLGDGVTGQAPPALDLVLLGLGSDGHCASLFPGKPALEEPRRWAVPVPEAGLDPFVPRVSFTLPLIDAAREVLFLITGAGKAEMVARAFGTEPDVSLPAARVAPAGGTLTVLLDREAAAALPDGAGT